MLLTLFLGLLNTIIASDSWKFILSAQTADILYLKTPDSQRSLIGLSLPLVWQYDNMLNLKFFVIVIKKMDA